MTNDFIIESGTTMVYGSDEPVPYGILNAYHGSGGDIVIPEGVTRIDRCVFQDNHTIRSVRFPETLKEISRQAFYHCTSLEEVFFPEKLEEIGEQAFAGCTALKEAVLPRKMNRIAVVAFCDCTGLKKLVLPEELHRIGNNPFAGLTGLEELVFPCSAEDDNLIKFWSTYILDLDDLAMHYLKGHIQACPALDKAFFKRLNTKANRKRFFLAYLREQNGELIATFLGLIPKMSPEELDEYIQAAQGYPEICALFLDYKTRLYSAADLIQRQEEQTEKDLGLRERTVADWKKIYKINSEGHITGYKDTAPIAEIPHKVRNTTFEVGANAFKHCEFLESVTIAEGVQLIDKSAFNGCAKLADISIPSTITRIGASAFKNCTALTHVHFPGGITNIGSKAFEGCESLVIHAPAGSKIIKYAEKNGIPFAAE